MNPDCEAANNLETISDTELIRRMNDACDEAAFAEIFRRHQSNVFRFALHLSGSNAVAEDATQEVFMFLIRDAARYDAARGTLPAYLIGVARNHVLRLIERRSSFIALDEINYTNDGEAGCLTARDNPHTDAARREEIQTVRRAILALPVRYRETLVLCDLHEASYEEAARILECPVGTIRSRLNRARAMLAERLHESENSNRGGVLVAKYCV